MICSGLLWWRHGTWPLPRHGAAQESFQITPMDAISADVTLPWNRKYHGQDIWQKWKRLCIAAWWFCRDFRDIGYDKRVSENLFWKFKFGKSHIRKEPDHAREEPLSYIWWKGEWKLIDSEVTRVNFRYKCNILRAFGRSKKLNENIFRKWQRRLMKPPKDVRHFVHWTQR